MTGSYRLGHFRQNTYMYKTLKISDSLYDLRWTVCCYSYRGFSLLKRVTSNICTCFTMSKPALIFISDDAWPLWWFMEIQFRILTFFELMNLKLLANCLLVIRGVVLWLIEGCDYSNQSTLQSLIKNEPT